MPNGNAKNPLLSVIIPCYNVSKFLPTAFEQLKNQTYKNLQIIFIDDGSADQTLKLLTEYCNVNPNAQVVTQTNSGVGLARKMGLERVNGQYFTFYDVDDLLSPTHFENLVNLIVGQNADMAVCSFERIKGKKASNGKSVKVSLEENKAIIELNVAVEYGVKIPEVVNSVQENVKKTVEAMTGLIVDKVNVNVQNIYVPKKEQTETVEA